MKRKKIGSCQELMETSLKEYVKFKRINDFIRENQEEVVVSGHELAHALLIGFFI